MKTGMFTCGHQRLPIEHAFRDASELGYDGIEIWGGRPHAFAPDLKAGGIKQIKALAQTYQMPIIGYTCNQVNHLIPTRVLVKGGEITCKILK